MSLAHFDHDAPCDELIEHTPQYYFNPHIFNIDKVISYSYKVYFRDYKAERERDAAKN